MASDRRRRSGQAMTEFAIAVLALILLIVAMVEFLPIFLDNIGLLKEVREEAGIKAVTSESGTVAADRRDEFGFEIPGVLPGDSYTSGFLSEKMHIPAANLSCGEPVRIPDIGGLEITLQQENRAGTSDFISGLAHFPPAQAIGRVKGAFVGAGWELMPIEHDFNGEYAAVFSFGGRAIAAAHADYASDGSGLTCVTIVARTAGGEM